MVRGVGSRDEPVPPHDVRQAKLHRYHGVPLSWGIIIFMRLWQEQVQRLYCTLDSDSSDEPTNTIPGTLAECEEREKVRILGEILWIKDCRIVEAIVALLLFHSFIKKSKVNNFSPLREGSISFSSVTYCLIETLKNQYFATLEHSSLVYIYWTRP